MKQENIKNRAPVKSKHLIMGTAGHVDHGKTALVKALTGIDCDTHKEEKRRGITINLGFAHLALPTGAGAGIVDVPGHRDFVHTMVGGACGIDFVLLVIAADAGVMPQTREHLDIMRILGVKHGLVALTKTDLVQDPELLTLSLNEVHELTKNTFLQHAPILQVSAKTGNGLEKLKTEINTLMNRIDEKPGEGIFRLFIDRVFSVDGFGTVVTGSVTGGTLNVKDTAYLLPGDRGSYQVRRLERHGREVPFVQAGDRASINLVGLDRTRVRKGMVITNHRLNATAMLDARLEILETPVKSTRNGLTGPWSQVIFHAGTHESQARIHLIDKNKLEPGQSGLAQIHLDGPCVLTHGDRFVIRGSSGDTTLGGGEVIDAAPLHHRRRPEKLIQQMNAVANGKLPELVAAETAKSPPAIDAEAIARRLNITRPQVEACPPKKLPGHIIRYSGTTDRPVFFTTRAQQEKLEPRILDAIREIQKNNPLLDRGATPAEIRGRLKIEKGSAGERLMEKILDQMHRKGTLTQRDKTWLPAQRPQHQSTGPIEDHLDYFSRHFEKLQMQTPLMSDLRREAQKRNLSEHDLKQILYVLTRRGELYRVKDEYIHAGLAEACREKLLRAFSGREQGFSVAEFRDLVGGNRKICLLLLALYDSQLLTRRRGDLRVIIKSRGGNTNENHDPNDPDDKNGKTPAH